MMKVLIAVRNILTPLALIAAVLAVLTILALVKIAGIPLFVLVAGGFILGAFGLWLHEVGEMIWRSR